jgi:hypothetical protein
MRDPERLSAGRGATAFERGLLDAGRSERLPDQMKRRMERALGLVGGIATGAAAGTVGTLAGKSLAEGLAGRIASPLVSKGGGALAANQIASVAGITKIAGVATNRVGAASRLAGPAAGRLVGGVAAMKMGTLVAITVGVVALGLGGGVLGARWFRHRPPQSPAPAVGGVMAPVTNAPVPSESPPASASPPVSALPVSDLPSGASSAGADGPRDLRRSLHHAPARHALAATPAGTSADLRRQIDLIDQARGALQSGAALRALRLLQHYDAAFPHGSLAPESVALRVQALVRSGRLAEARALARRFVAANPGSPLAPRIEMLSHGGTDP